MLEHEVDNFQTIVENGFEMYLPQLELFLAGQVDKNLYKLAFL